MELELAIDSVGGFGLAQFVYCSLLCLVRIVMALNLFGYAFVKVGRIQVSLSKMFVVTIAMESTVTLHIGD